MTGGYCIGQHRPKDDSQPWLHIRITWGALKIDAWVPPAPGDSGLIGLQCNFDVGIFKYFPCVPVTIVATQITPKLSGLKQPPSYVMDSVGQGFG